MKCSVGTERSVYFPLENSCAEKSRATINIKREQMMVFGSCRYTIWRYFWLLLLFLMLTNTMECMYRFKIRSAYSEVRQHTNIDFYISARAMPQYKQISMGIERMCACVRVYDFRVYFQAWSHTFIQTDR